MRERTLQMVRLKRLVLPLLGTLTLAVTASAWRAQAQSRVTIGLVSLSPRVVESNAQASITVHVTGNGVNQVFVQTLAKTGVTAGARTQLNPGNNNYSGQLLAPLNKTKQPVKSVSVQVTVTNSDGGVIKRQVVGTITVNPGKANGGGDTPPPPPNI